MTTKKTIKRTKTENHDFFYRHGKFQTIFQSKQIISSDSRFLDFSSIICKSSSSAGSYSVKSILTLASDAIFFWHESHRSIRQSLTKILFKCLSLQCAITSSYVANFNAHGVQQYLRVFLAGAVGAATGRDADTLFDATERWPCLVDEDAGCCRPCNTWASLRYRTPLVNCSRGALVTGCWTGAGASGRFIGGPLGVDDAGGWKLNNGRLFCAKRPLVWTPRRWLSSRTYDLHWNGQRSQLYKISAEHKFCLWSCTKWCNKLKA